MKIYTSGGNQRNSGNQLPKSWNTIDVISRQFLTGITLNEGVNRQYFPGKKVRPSRPSVIVDYIPHYYCVIA